MTAFSYSYQHKHLQESQANRLFDFLNTLFETECLKQASSVIAAIDVLQLRERGRGSVRPGRLHHHPGGVQGHGGRGGHAHPAGGQQAVRQEGGARLGQQQEGRRHCLQ